MKKFGVYLVNQNSGQTYPLAFDKENKIGRGFPGENPELAVALPDATISKLHASIQLDSQTHLWHFKNLSSNGSLVDNTRVLGTQTLHHGDRISIGPFDLSFYEKFRADEGTMEMPIMKRRDKRSQLPGNWDEEETTPLGSTMETVAILTLLALSAFIFVCCFVI